VREDVPFDLQLAVLATQPCEFLPLGRGQPVVAHTGVTISLRDPVDDRLCSRLELACELLRRTSGLYQLDDAGPEFRRLRGTMPAHFDTS